MEFSVKYFSSKYDQIRRKLQKYLMGNFMFCAVKLPEIYSKYSEVYSEPCQTSEMELFVKIHAFL